MNDATATLRTLTLKQVERRLAELDIERAALMAVRRSLLDRHPRGSAAGERPDTYTVRDLCERFGVGEHTVLGWIRSGDLKAVNVGRKPGGKKPRWRVTPEAVSAFESMRGAIPPRPSSSRRRRKSDPDIINFY